MKTPKLNIELSDNFLTKSSFATNLNIIPHPVAIYLSLTQEIFLNDLAIEALDISREDSINMRDFFENNEHLLKLKNDNVLKKLLNKRASLNLFDGRTIQVEFSVNSTHDGILGNIYFITFRKVITNSSTESMFSMTMVKDDILKLRENLNKEGNEKLNRILNTYFNEEYKQLSLEDLINYEKELQIIQKEFPVLSRREVLLCGLLLNDIDFNDIAKLTNRSLNSVFVTVHRINKKTNIPNKIELSRVLKEIVAKARLE